MVEALQYKLGCFGVLVDVTTEVFCNNRLVVKNSSVTISVLDSRHNTICYHRAREAHTTGVLRVGWIPGGFNPKILFPKTTIPGKKINNLVESICSDAVSQIGGIKKS